MLIFLLVFTFFFFFFLQSNTPLTAQENARPNRHMFLLSLRRTG